MLSLRKIFSSVFQIAFEFAFWHFDPRSNRSRNPTAGSSANIIHVSHTKEGCTGQFSTSGILQAQAYPEVQYFSRPARLNRPPRYASAILISSPPLNKCKGVSRTGSCRPHRCAAWCLTPPKGKHCHEVKRLLPRQSRIFGTITPTRTKSKSRQNGLNRCRGFRRLMERPRNAFKLAPLQMPNSPLNGRIIIPLRPQE